LVEDGFHILGESRIGRRCVGQQAQCLSQRPSAAGRARGRGTVVWVDDDIDRPLTVDYNYLLMTGDGFPSAAGDADFFRPDRGHDLRLPSEPYGIVRNRTGLSHYRWSRVDCGLSNLTEALRECT
jgi:hypothetical protein